MRSDLPKFIWNWLASESNKTLAQLRIIWERLTDPETFTKFILLIAGLLFTPLTPAAALWGYKRSYERLWQERYEDPTLAPEKLPRSFIITMSIYASYSIAAIIALVVFLKLVVFTVSVLSGFPSKSKQKELRAEYNGLRYQRDSLDVLVAYPSYFDGNYSIKTFDSSKSEYTIHYVTRKPANTRDFYSLSYNQRDSVRRSHVLRSEHYRQVLDTISDKMNVLTSRYPMLDKHFWDGEIIYPYNNPLLPNPSYGNPLLGEFYLIVIPKGTWTNWPFVRVVLFFLNLFILFLVFVRFGMWQKQMRGFIFEAARHGTARFASDHELTEALADNHDNKGFYIGGSHYYSKLCHLLTVSGTRGGKGTNLIIPNLTKLGHFEGSWVIVDPKGENAAITARIQKEKFGRNVIVLNPWKLLEDSMPNVAGQKYNPLDLITDPKSPDFSDDAQIIAEMIVPIDNKQGENKFFYDRARSIITSLIMHIVISQPDEKKNLKTLWEMLRLDTDGWDTLVATMKHSDNEVVSFTANELISLVASERTFSTIMATAQECTDFLKSTSLQNSLSSSEFNINDLTKGNTALYIIIPADKLKTHYQWLRLVVTTALRAVIRNHDKEVCFLLDEFYALGYISEIDVALGTYAGYGVHIWAVLQNLIQLKSMYGENWENFISSCSVRHFFNVSDNFSADYISKMFGQKSVPSAGGGASARALVNPDELRRSSADYMYAVIDHFSPIPIEKSEYYKNPLLKEGVDYDKNPYIK